MLRILGAGLLSGLLMAGLLRFVESVTKIKVYTLLLNVDYIPIIKKITGTEWIELSLHMIVAIVLSYLIATFIINKDENENKALLKTVVVCLIIGVLLFPSTMLSDRTPDLFDLYAWFWWLTSHIIYGWTLGMLLIKNKK